LVGDRETAIVRRPLVTHRRSRSPHGLGGPPNADRPVRALRAVRDRSDLAAVVPRRRRRTLPPRDAVPRRGTAPRAAGDAAAPRSAPRRPHAAPLAANPAVPSVAVGVPARRAARLRADAARDDPRGRDPLGRAARPGARRHGGLSAAGGTLASGIR